MTRQSRGPLLVIGGSEDRRNERTILRRFVSLAGGPSAKLVLIGTATTVPDDVEVDYKRAFADIADDVTFLPLSTREEANDEAIVAPLETADGIFFTGGDQLRMREGEARCTQLEVIFEESEAVHTALAKATPGDIVVAFVEHAEQYWPAQAAG